MRSTASKLGPQHGRLYVVPAYVDELRQLETPRFRFERPVASPENDSGEWAIYTFESVKPLADEDEEALGPYLYPVLLRRGECLLLLSYKRQIVTELCDSTLRRLHPASVNTNRLCRHLFERSADYDTLKLSSFSAKVTSEGKLRTVHAVGEDIGIARFFADRWRDLAFYRCGLTPVGALREVVRLHKSGFASVPSDALSSRSGNHETLGQVVDGLVREGFVR